MFAEPIRPSIAERRLLGHDRPLDLAHVLGFVFAFGALSLLIRRIAAIDRSHVDRPSLLAGAVATHPLPAALLALVAAGLVVLRRDRLFARWSDLDQGSTLRLIALLPLALLTWQGAMYDQNYLTGRWNTSDRLLLVALAVGCVLRPGFLLLFAVQSRIISGQFEPIFHTIAAQNIDALAVIVLVAVGTMHLWFAITGRNRTAPVLLVLMAAVGSHFFVPGKSKLEIDWVQTTDLANLPLSAYISGWMGAGDGSWARRLSTSIEPINRPLLLVIQVFELGALLAVLHHRLFRLWLLPAVAFHIVLFAVTGYWFITWVVVELSLVMVLFSRRLRPWVETNSTPMRALLTAAMIALGARTLFDPPGLAWLDAPVSYGYRIEAIADRGETVNVPIAAFSPFEQEIAFGRLGLSPTEPLTAGYGAIGSPTAFRTLSAVDTPAELAELAVASDPDHVRASQEFILEWFDHVNASGPPPWWTVLGPPDHFWTSAPPPTIEPGRSIERLVVYRITAIHRDGRSTTELARVLEVEAGPDGRGVITFRPDSG